MKLKVLKEDLIKNIQYVQNIISSRTNLPVLSNILLETQSNNKLKLTSTDLDIGISTMVGVEVIEEGSITVPAKRFNDIIRELPNEEIHIHTMKNNFTIIKCSNCQFKIAGLPKEDFPKLPQFEEVPNLTIEQRSLKKMLNMVYFSMSNDETRYVLNGACFFVKENTLSIVATDGKRLSFIKEKINNELKETSFIVPSKAVYELNRILLDEGDVKISYSENQVRFELGDIMVVSRLIEGDYPNYEQVIPKQSKDKLIVNREQFLLGIKRAALLATQESLSIKLDILKNKIIVSKSSPNIGEAREEIEATYNGQDISVGFNPNYLKDVLKVIPKDEIEIELLGADKPAVIRLDDWYLYLVLPMQLV